MEPDPGDCYGTPKDHPCLEITLSEKGVPPRADSHCRWLILLHLIFCISVVSCGEAPSAPGEPPGAEPTSTQSPETEPAPALKLQASLGWDENFPLVKCGFSAPVQVTISTGQDPVEAELRVSTPQITTGVGQRGFVWSRPISLPAGSSKRFQAPIFVGADQPPVLVEIKEAGQTLQSAEVSPIPVEPDASLVLVLGPRRGSHAPIQRFGKRQPLYPSEPRLPRDDASIAALDVILIDGTLLLTPAPTAVAALKSWVHCGGTLVVCCGTQGLPTSNPEILALLPAQPTGTAGSFDVRHWLAENGLSPQAAPDSDIETNPSTSLPGITPGILTAYSLKPSDPTARPLFVGPPVSSTHQRDSTDEHSTLGFTARRGLGRVTVLGFSLTSVPARPLLQQLASVARLIPRRRALALAPPEADPIIRTFVPAKGFNLNSIQRRRHRLFKVIREHVMAATMFTIPSRTAILGFLGIYVLTILGLLTLGPRLLGRQEWFWLAVPVVAGSFVTTTWTLTTGGEQDSKALIHIEVLEVASGARSATSRSLVSIHSPLGTAHQILLPPGLTAEPTSPSKVRGLALPNLRLSPVSARGGNQLRVVNFSILAKSTRTLRLAGPVTLDGFVSISHMRSSQNIPAVRITNHTSETFTHGALFVGGKVRELEGLEPGGEATIVLGMAKNHLIQTLRKGQQAPRQASQGLSTDERRAVRRKLSQQLLTQLALQLATRQHEWIGPMAILISEGSSSDLSIDGRPVVGLKLRAVIVHASIESPPRTVRKPWALTRATSSQGCSFLKDKTVLSNGALIIDVEAPPELPESSIAGILLNVTQPPPPDMSLETMAPDGSWVQLEIDSRRPITNRTRWITPAINPASSIHAARLRFRGDGAQISDLELLLRPVNLPRGPPK